MAVNFMNEKLRAENISSISSTTESLLQGAALIIGAALKDTDHSSNNKTGDEYTEKAKVNTTFIFLKFYFILFTMSKSEQCYYSGDNIQDIKIHLCFISFELKNKHYF